MINTFHISGYRSIQTLELALGSITIVTGANGCGKSNLYKAVHLLSQAANGVLAKTLATEGGMPSVLWAGERKQITRTKKPVRLTLCVKTDKFNYEFSCGLPAPTVSKFSLDPQVKEEFVWLSETRRASNTLLERQVGSTWIMDQHDKRVSYPVCLDQAESALSQLQEPHLYPELFALSCEIKKWRFYHNFRTDQDALIRIPQVGVRTPILSNDGHDLAAALQTIIEIGDHQQLYNTIDRAFPNSKLLIQVDDKSRFEVQLKMPGILRPLEARELSDGTLRYLCLIAALLSPRPATFLILNEPEMSLHPDLLEPLAELIVFAARFSQILITTHSQQLTAAINKITQVNTINLILTEKGTVLSEIL